MSWIYLAVVGSLMSTVADTGNVFTTGGHGIDGIGPQFRNGWPMRSIPHGFPGFADIEEYPGFDNVDEIFHNNRYNAVPFRRYRGHHEFNAHYIRTPIGGMHVSRRRPSFPGIPFGRRFIFRMERRPQRNINSMYRPGRFQTRHGTQRGRVRLMRPGLIPGQIRHPLFIVHTPRRILPLVNFLNRRNAQGIPSDTSGGLLAQYHDEYFDNFPDLPDNDFRFQNRGWMFPNNNLQVKRNRFPFVQNVFRSSSVMPYRNNKYPGFMKLNNFPDSVEELQDRLEEINDYL